MQHDDHIWLTVGGQAWVIRWMRWPFIGLWRGYEPDLQFSLLDMTAFNAESYVKKAVELLHYAA
jgi:hypothetical protein